MNIHPNILLLAKLTLRPDAKQKHRRIVFNILTNVLASAMSIYVVNIDLVSLFTCSCFLLLVNFYCIDVFYQFE
jgi:hypothetical protein